jgi:putative membrane protein
LNPVVEEVPMFGIVVQGWCPWCGPMGSGGGFMMLLWIVLLVVLVAIVWGLGQRGGWFRSTGAEDRAEAVLRERFARGEIDEATYRRMLDELRR